jgi:hypothetical protein
MLCAVSLQRGESQAFSCTGPMNALQVRCDFHGFKGLANRLPQAFLLRAIHNSDQCTENAYGEEKAGLENSSTRAL